MEPVTLTLFISVPLLLAGTALYIGRRVGSKSGAVEEARKRCRERAEVRAFADTEPEHDHYRTGLEYVTGRGVHVTEDTFNQQGLPLTAEQLNTIGIIFDGYHPPIRKEVTHHGGPSANAAAGVPVNMSAFDELNAVPAGLEVEYLEPDFQWPESSTRD